MIHEDYQYSDGDTDFIGLISHNENHSSPKPAVLICPDWSGRNAFANEKAKALSEYNLVGFALDVFGNGKQGTTKSEKTELIQPFLDDRALLRKRLLAAYNTVRELDFVDPHNIAVIGFCFGGLCALDLARSGAALKGAVSFHGFLSPPEHLPNKHILAKILALHGYDDPMVTQEQITAFSDEMTQANVDWQIHMYGNTLHAFTNPQANDAAFGTVYNEIANQRAMQSLYNFLNEIFNLS